MLIAAEKTDTMMDKITNKTLKFIVTFASYFSSNSQTKLKLFALSCFEPNESRTLTVIVIKNEQFLNRNK